MKKGLKIFFIAIVFMPRPYAEIKIGCVGDSLMADAQDSTHPEQFGWAETLSLFLNSDIEVMNFGVAGTSSKSYINGGHWDAAKSQNCNYYFIGFGHNDSKADNRFTDPDSTYKSYLTQYITEARALGAIPILITPPARRVFTSDVELKKKNEPYANAMIEVAVALDVAYIDMFNITANYYEYWGESVSDAYGDNADGTHFSYMGAKWCSRWVTSSLLWSEHTDTNSLKAHITSEIPNQRIDVPQSMEVSLQFSHNLSGWSTWGNTFTHAGGFIRLPIWAEHSSSGFAKISYLSE